MIPNIVLRQKLLKFCLMRRVVTKESFSWKKLYLIKIFKIVKFLILVPNSVFRHFWNKKNDPLILRTFCLCYLHLLRLCLCDNANNLRQQIHKNSAKFLLKLLLHSRDWDSSDDIDMEKEIDIMEQDLSYLL